MSALGLTRRQRVRVRGLVVRGAMLAFRNREKIHYTQGPARWQGIAKHLRSYKGEFPNFADCSAFTTWLLWDATRRYKLHDFVNGAAWKAGYTGTQIEHGRKLKPGENKMPGDLVFYGNPSGQPVHVAVYVGGGRVVSHGSEPGPFLLRWDYRQVHSVRRYIR